MNGLIKVLVADDHEVVRQGIKTILATTSDLRVVGEARDGVEVLKKIKEMEIDVVLLDFDMPRKSGLEILIEIKAIKPQIPVLILSIFPEKHYGLRFLKAGASGYLGKASVSVQLVEAVRKVAQGGKFVSPEMTDRLIGELNKSNKEAPHEKLTDREFQVFHLIALGRKIKEIADELNLSINTISTYRARILEKMGMDSNSEIVRYAIDNSLIK
ncbi:MULTISPECIES: response regulator [unclassified Nitrospina]|uniref:response regulator n=1 Tax=unclassified Nitrospina TaxID=2638683 RepID=UPI003F9700CA